MKDKISKVFDIEPIEQEGFKVKNMFVDISKDTPQDDQILARQNIRDLITAGMKALEETIEIAKESESPRAFEVAFAAMKTISELNSQLIDIHQAEKKMTQQDNSPNASPHTNITNNIAFVGTQKDLNAMITKSLTEITKES